MLPTFACRCQSTAGTASSCLGGRMSASLLTFGDSRLSFSRSRDAKCAHQTDDRRSRSRHSRRARVAITIATSGLKRHADAAVSSLEACPTPALRSESAPASCYARAGIRQPLTSAVLHPRCSIRWLADLCDSPCTCGLRLVSEKVTLCAMTAQAAPRLAVDASPARRPFAPLAPRPRSARHRAPTTLPIPRAFAAWRTIRR